MSKAIWVLSIACLLPLDMKAQGEDPNLSMPVIGAIGCSDCPALAQVKKKNSDLSPFAQKVMKNLGDEKSDHNEQKSKLDADQSR